jgi:hypothetical protein
MDANTEQKEKAIRKKNCKHVIKDRTFHYVMAKLQKKHSKGHLQKKK